MRKVLILLIVLMASTSAIFSSGAKEESDEIVIWHSNSGILGEAFQHLVDEWNDSHSVKINAIYQGAANDVLTKIKAAEMAGQELPDIAQLDATAGLDMLYSDSVVHIEDLGIDTSDILPVAYAAYDSMNGHIGVPFNSSSLLFYYNKTMFDKAGATVPGTLDEFIAEAAKIKEANGVTAFSGVPTTYELCTFLGAWQGGSFLTDRRNGHDGVSTEVLFDDNGSFVAFLDKWKALYDTGALENLTSGVSDAFCAGRTASMLASSSNLTTVLQNVGDRFEVAVAPVFGIDEEATGGSNVGGGCLVAFSDAEEVKEAISYFIGADAQLYWAEHTGYMPISLEAIGSEGWKEFTEENPLFSVAIDQAVSSSENVTGLWIPSAYQVYYSFQSTIKDTLENGLSAEDALTTMKNMIEESLRDYEV